MNADKPKSKNLIVILWLIIFFPIGLSLMWLKTNWNKTVKWSVTGVFALFILLGIISSSNPSNTTAQQTTNTVKQTASATPTVKPTVTPTPKPTPTPTPIKHDSYGFPEDYQTVTVTNLAKLPSKYNMKSIVVTCEVVSFPKDDTGNAAGVNCSDPNDFTSMVQIAASFDLTKVNTGDKIMVYGMGTGSGSGKNAYGGDVTMATMMGLYINDFTTGYNNAK